MLWEFYEWTPNHTEIICKWLSCGSAVSMERNTETFKQEMSEIYSCCIERVPSARECRFSKEYSTVTIKLNCLEPRVEPDRTTDGNLRLTVLHQFLSSVWFSCCCTECHLLHLRSLLHLQAHQVAAVRPVS